MSNKMKITFSAISENESFARTAVAGFIMFLNPTVEQITDVKTAVSEAVTNCVVHGYPDTMGEITLECEINEGVLHIKISDNGVGIENLNKVLEPFYSSKAMEEHAGMGFTIMRTFMDSFSVESALNVGTTVTMTKSLSIA
ncbi:MAG: anti-sigma F factor [Clostridiales bacterium]|nr:anti-sigma F factor [Clostridiales bacterium]